jgi:hypothetical protein
MFGSVMFPVRTKPTGVVFSIEYADCMETLRNKLTIGIKNAKEELTANPHCGLENELDNWQKVLEGMDDPNLDPITHFTQLWMDGYASFLLTDEMYQDIYREERIRQDVLLMLYSEEGALIGIVNARSLW